MQKHILLIRLWLFAISLCPQILLANTPIHLLSAQTESLPEQAVIIEKDTVNAGTTLAQPLVENTIFTYETCVLEASPKQPQTFKTNGEETVITTEPIIVDNLTAALCSNMLLLQQQQNLTIEGEKISAAAGLLNDIYRQRKHTLIWTDHEQTQTLMSNISNIDEDGLIQEDYHYQSIMALQQRLEITPNDPENQAKLDILRTNALLRLVYHLKFGKISPHSLDPNWNYSRDFIDADPVAVFNTALVSNQNLTSYLDQQRNPSPLYSSLKQALKKYRNIALSGGWPSIAKGRILRPGKRDKRVPVIYQRLLITGDITTPAPKKSVATRDLVAGIKHFQSRHTLKSDGAVGPQTLAALNVSVNARIDQIRANMERLRWIMPDLKDKFVLVNIAGFQAYLVEDQKLIWQSKVQVGKNARQTPVFKDTITYLELNPTWTVPPTIIKEDIMPKLRRGVDVLAQKGLSLLSRRGKNINPASIDWQTVSARNFPYMLRQQPGPRNALGRIKIMFPNKHAVYLHDTPSKHKFKPIVRAFSSGCVRLQNPFELAELLLENSDKWNKKKFDRILRSRRTSRINLPNPTPILMVYATIDFDFDLDPSQDPILKFNPDIYKRDAAIIKGLKQPFTFTAPTNINARL